MVHFSVAHHKPAVRTRRINHLSPVWRHIRKLHIRRETRISGESLVVEGNLEGVIVRIFKFKRHGAPLRIGRVAHQRRLARYRLSPRVRHARLRYIHAFRLPRLKILIYERARSVAGAYHRRNQHKKQNFTHLLPSLFSFERHQIRINALFFLKCAD